LLLKWEWIHFTRLKSGIIYTKEFLIEAFAPVLMLLLLPVIIFLIRKQKIGGFIINQVITFSFIHGCLFLLFFYSYSGGDWMPAWRFYASLIPVFRNYTGCYLEPILFPC